MTASCILLYLLRFGGLIQALQCRRNDRDGVSNHRCLICLLSRLFRRRSKKASKLRVAGLREGNLPVTDGFPSQRVGKMFPFHDVIMTARIHGFVVGGCHATLSFTAILVTIYVGFSGSGIQCAIPVLGVPVKIFCPNISCLLFGVNKVFSKNLPLRNGHEFFFAPSPHPTPNPHPHPIFCIQFVYWSRWYPRMWYSSVKTRPVLLNVYGIAGVQVGAWLSNYVPKC